MLPCLGGRWLWNPSLRYPSRPKFCRTSPGHEPARASHAAAAETDAGCSAGSTAAAAAGAADCKLLEIVAI